jgi:hypothetical protein
MNFVQSYLVYKLNKADNVKPDVTKGTLNGMNERFNHVKDLIYKGEAKYGKEQKTVKEIIENYEQKKKKDIKLDEEMKKYMIKEAKGNKESLENKIRSLEANIKLLENNEMLNNISKLDNSFANKELVDENIRASRIKEIKQTKSLLENKLKTIDNHIDGLINEENINNKKKIDLKKFIENFENDKRKVEIEARKWEKDNQERVKRILDNQLNQEKRIKEITEKHIEKQKLETENKRKIEKKKEEEVLQKYKAKRKQEEEERKEWEAKVLDIKNQFKEVPSKLDIPKNITNTKLNTNELKYIYELKEEKFKEKIKKEKELKEKTMKEKLSEIKTLFRPIQREEIDDFARKYEETKQEKLLKLERDRALRLEEIESQNQNLPKPESQFYEKAVKEDKEYKENLEKAKLEKIYKQMKIRNFSKAVKENVVPKIDEDLRMKLQLKKEQLENPKLYIEHRHKRKKPRVLLKKPDPKHPRQYGKKDGKWKVDLNKSINSVRRSYSQLKDRTLRSNSALSRGRDYSRDEKSFVQFNKTSTSAKYSRSRSARKSKSKKKRKPLPKPPDYLTEMRIKKVNEERSLSRESSKREKKNQSKKNV